MYDTEFLEILSHILLIKINRIIIKIFKIERLL